MNSNTDHFLRKFLHQCTKKQLQKIKYMLPHIYWTIYFIKVISEVTEMKATDKKLCVSLMFLILLVKTNGLENEHCVKGEKGQSCEKKTTEKTKKNVLIVYAHYLNHSSFNAAMLETTVSVFKEQGCDVTVSDLYSQKFNPVFGLNDFTDSRTGDEYHSYEELSEEALKAGTLVDDIITEQEKVQQADLIIFQFPLIWFGMPAILKGWFDRVTTPGFAYDYKASKYYEKGLLKNKKAVLSVTMDSALSTFSPYGINGDIEVVLYPMWRGTLQFIGLQTLRPHISEQVSVISDGGRKQLLANWKSRLGRIWNEKPMPYIPMSEFDLKKGGLLKKSSKYRNSEFAPNPGTHCNKAKGR